jgi:hypothetical protein
MDSSPMSKMDTTEAMGKEDLGVNKMGQSS